MTPAELKTARQALGLSQNALALALRVADGRTIRRWEAGERDIPGPAIVAIEYMTGRTCERCRFWETGCEADKDWGVCSRGASENGEPRYPDSTAIAADYECWEAWLRTRRDHGCRMWDAI